MTPTTTVLNSTKQLLTLDSLRCRIAAAAGWHIEHRPATPYKAEAYFVTNFASSRPVRHRGLESLPDYPNDADARAEFERTIPQADAGRYCSILFRHATGREYDGTTQDLLDAMTAIRPEHQCLAFLELKGYVATTSPEPPAPSLGASL